MASQLPTERDLGVVRVQPGLGVAQYRGATGEEGAPGRALVQAGGQFEAAAGHLIKAQEEFDALQAEDRYNQLQEKYNQIEHDENSGWRSAKGENAFKSGFVEKYSEQFEEERKRLVDTLDTPNGKRRFAQLSAAAATRERGKLYGHSAEQRGMYHAKVFNDSMELAQANAWRSHGNNELFAAELARVKSLTEQFARSWAVGASQESIDLAVQKAESAMWTSRISGALDSGNSKLAKELMGMASGSLTTADKQKLDPRVQSQVRLSEAVDKVDAILAKNVSPDLNAAYPAAKIDEELRKAFANDPEGLMVARREADYRGSKLREAQKESRDQNVSTVVDMFYVQKKSEAQVMATPQFQQMSGEDKARFVTQAENYRASQASKAAALESRAFTAEARALQRVEREGKAAVLQYLMNPEAVASMTPAAINALALQLGPDNARDILNYHHQLNKPKALGNAKIDVQTFKTVLNDYYDPKTVELFSKSGKLTEEQLQKKAEMGEIFMRVNQRIEYATVKKKAPLEQDEKEKIMRDALKEKIKVDYGWSPGEITKRDIEMPAIAVPATGDRAEEIRGRAIVPIKEIPKETLDVYIAGLRRSRRGAERMTDKQLIDAYKSVLERAHAAGRLGGTADDVDAILSGVKK